MKMNKKLTKRILAVALSAVVALTTVFTGTPVTANAAAAKTSITSFKSVKAENTVKYTIKNLKKGQYAKVTFSGTAKSNVLVKKGESKITSGKTQIVGTGKDIVLNVTATNKAAGKNYTLTVKTYKAKNDNLVSTTATGSVFVYKLCTGITLDKATADVKVGETVTLTATKAPEDTTQKVKWTTSDEKIATVANGVVTAVAAGTATITVKCGKFTATCEVKVAAKEATEVTATVTGANTVKLVFNGIVDTTKAKISLAKGSVSVNTDSIKYGEANTAILTTVSKLTKGDYLVTVSGITEKPFTATFKVENDETLTKIELVSKIAPAATDPGTTAKVSFKTLNQYGEGMQISSGLTWTSSTGVAVTDGKTTDAAGFGKFTITAANGGNFVPNATVYVTGVYVSGITSVVVNETVTIGMASKLDTIEVAGIYDIKTRKIGDLPAGFAVNRYDLLLTAYDQYGNPFKMVDTAGGADNKWDNLVVTSKNPLLVGGFEKDTDATVNGMTYQTIKLAPGTQVQKGGEAELQFISTSTGKNSNYTLKVAESAMLSKFTLIAPTALIAEGETVKIPFEAFDQTGKAITSFSALNPYVTLTGATLKQTANGSAYISYTAPSTGASNGADGNGYITSIITGNGHFSSIIITFKETAVPTTVMGFDANSRCSTEMAIGAVQTIKYSDLAIADQYGRQLSSAKVSDWMNTTDNVIEVTTSAVGAPIKLYQTAGTTDVDTAKITSKTTSATAILTAVTPGSSATKRFTFALKTAAGVMSGSAKVLTFSVVQESEYVKYEVSALPTMYIKTATAVPGTDYDVKVKVYGIKADGTKVKLPYSDNYYTLALSVPFNTPKYDATKMKVADGTIHQNAVEAFTDAAFTTAGGYANVKGSVRVTVLATASGAAAQVVDLPIEFSTIAPYAADYDLDVYTPQVTIVEKENFATLQTVNTGKIKNDSLASLIAGYCDQYGNWNFVATPTITISGVVANANFRVVTNGTTTTNITGATLGDKFVATYEVGKIKVDIKITVGTEGSAFYEGAAPTITLTKNGTYNDTFNFNAVGSTSMHYLIDANPTATEATVMVGTATTTASTLAATSTDHNGKYIHIIATDAFGNSKVVTYLITATDPAAGDVTIALQP